MATQTLPKRSSGTTSALVPAVALAVNTDNGELIIPATAQSHAGFREWACSDRFPERGRISFVGGEIHVDMSPEEIQHHAKVKQEISFVLGQLNKTLNLGEFCPDGVLLSNDTAELSTEPDGLFVTWESLESRRARLVQRHDNPEEFMEVAGTPDMVLEVISRYSERKDTKLLRRRYFLAGIPEYWLVDARGTKIEFNILLRGKEDYSLQTTRGGWQRSPLFGRRFRLVRERGRMNLWQYTLEVKVK